MKQTFEILQRSYFENKNANAMKKGFILLALMISVAISAQEKIKWVSVSDLENLQKEEPRKVLIDVYTKWCGPCKMMMAQTFTDKEVINYINKNFYAVKFDAEGNEKVNFKGYEWTNEDYDPNKRGRNGTHDLTLAIAPVNARIAYPTIVYMDENLNIIQPIQGMMRPPQIMPLLTYMANDKYKDQNYDEYLKEYNQQ